MQYVDRAEADIAKVHQTQEEQKALKASLQPDDIEKIVSAVKEKKEATEQENAPPMHHSSAKSQLNGSFSGQQQPFPPQTA